MTFQAGPETHNLQPATPSPELHLAQPSIEESVGLLAVRGSEFEIPRTPENESLFGVKPDGTGYKVIRQSSGVVINSLQAHVEMQDLRPPDAPERGFSYVDAAGNSANNARLLGLHSLEKTVTNNGVVYKHSADFELKGPDGQTKVNRVPVSDICALVYTAVEPDAEAELWENKDFTSEEQAA